MMRPGCPGDVGVVIHCAGPLAWEILIEGSAQGTVDELDSPTNAENRKTGRPGRRKESQLESVALRINRAELRRWLRSVMARVDVFTSREQQAVTCFDGTGRRAIPHELRQNERDAAGARYGVYVRGVHSRPTDVLPLPNHATHSDPGLHRNTESGKKGHCGSSILAGSSSMPINGRDALPTETVPICGAPSTDGASYSSTPRAFSF
jgi:hypothetical protein